MRPLLRQLFHGCACRAHLPPFQADPGRTPPDSRAPHGGSEAPGQRKSPAVPGNLSCPAGFSLHRKSSGRRLQAESFSWKFYNSGTNEKSSRADNPSEVQAHSGNLTGYAGIAESLQISSLYSVIVLSVEKRPLLALLRILILTQPSMPL